jgi:hypothetical protein
VRAIFSADEGGFDADEYAVVCWVAGDGHYLTFQRDAEGSAGGWGIYLEYDDQANGGYECVAACRLGPRSLSVDLAQPLNDRLAEITGFDVALRLAPGQWEAVRDGLRQVFRGHHNVLVETEPGATADGGACRLSGIRSSLSPRRC